MSVGRDPDQTRGAGRPLLAIDVGGTNLRAAVVATDGRIVERRRTPTPHDADCLEALAALAGDVCASGAVGGAVVGLPGRVDYARGALEQAPNLPAHWPAALTADTLAARLGVPVAVANDADLAAVGEAYLGAGRDADDVAYVTISTGVGAGVVLRRRLVRGRRSLAELGHTVIDRQAARRGDPATVEDLASGTAIGRRAADAGLDPDAEAVQRMAEQGDERAAAIWDEAITAAAVGITNLAFLFSPEVIVLGGGVGTAGEAVLEPVRAHLDTHGPPDLPAPIRVVAAALGDDAALIGAVRWHRAAGLEPA